MGVYEYALYKIELPENAIVRAWRDSRGGKVSYRQAKRAQIKVSGNTDMILQFLPIWSLKFPKGKVIRFIKGFMYKNIQNAKETLFCYFCFENDIAFVWIFRSCIFLTT